MGIKPLSSLTCIKSCEGMSKKILSDIQKENYSIDELMESYRQDKEHGGNTYDNIIQLGEFLKKIK